MASASYKFCSRLSCNIPQNLTPLHIQVRYRKPRHLPRAPSKGVDYFTKRYPTVADTKIGTEYYKAYNTAVASLTAALQEELLQKQLKEESAEKDDWKWDEEAHHKKCMEYNRLENERLNTKRLEYLAKLKESAELERKLEEQTYLEQQEKERKEKEEQLKKTLEESKNWMTLENCLDKVTEAVENPVNFNFAVDPKGKIVKRTAQRV